MIYKFLTPLPRKNLALSNKYLYNEALTIIDLTYNYNKRVVLINREGFSIKRSFIDIRNSILISLASGQKTINQISNETQINWKTVDRHLIYLIGKGWVREVFSSSYVRTFELNAFGEDYLRKNVMKDIHISDKKIIRIYGEQ